jgi:hypothetical protein
MKGLLRLVASLWEKPAYGVCLVTLLGLGYLLSGGGEVRLSLMFSPEKEQPRYARQWANDYRDGFRE